jgi:hypothetical protein
LIPITERSTVYIWSDFTESASTHFSPYKSPKNDSEKLNPKERDKQENKVMDFTKRIRVFTDYF